MSFLRYYKRVILDILDMPEHTHFKLWYQFRTLSEVYLRVRN